VLVHDGDRICLGEWAAVTCAIASCSVIGAVLARELLSRD
jgi:hypothetical protein